MDTQEDALQKAVYEGDVEKVGQLLDAGADSDGASIFSPLYCALLKGHNGVITKLLAAEVTVDQNSFVEAAAKGRIDLIQKGLDDETVDIAESGAKGFTALEVAKKNEYHDIVNLLQENGATDQ